MKRMIIILILIVASLFYIPMIPSNSFDSQTAPKPDIDKKSSNDNQSSTSYNCYFGNFHSHTSLSDGSGYPQEAYTYAREVGKADFFAITDHSDYFDNDLDWGKSQEWSLLKNAAINNTIDGKFIALAGFEMTWEMPGRRWGHINTFNTDWFLSSMDLRYDLKSYYKVLSQDKKSFSQWNHPGDYFGDFEKFGNYSASSDSAMKLIEVGNGDGLPGSNRYYTYVDKYIEALDKGWHIAPANNQDNHLPNWITSNDCRTVILAPSLTYDNIIEAVKALRVYATEDKNVTLNYKINDWVMGSIIKRPNQANLAININDPDIGDNVSRIELIADGGKVIYSEFFNSQAVNFTTSFIPNQKYCFARITQLDGNIIVTAPIWME